MGLRERGAVGLSVFRGHRVDGTGGQRGKTTVWPGTACGMSQGGGWPLRLYAPVKVTSLAVWTQPWQPVEKGPTVMLSPSSSLRTGSAKHLATRFAPGS